MAKIHFITFTILLLASSGLPAQDTIYRPATQVDTKGIWNQITVQSHNPEMDLSDPWFSGEQYFWFLPDDGLKVMIVGRADEERSGISSAELSMWKAAPTTMRIEWGPDGKALLHHPERPPLPVLITYYREDFSLPEGIHTFSKEDVPQLGDITITYLDRDNYNPLFFRLLRPYNPE